MTKLFSFFSILAFVIIFSGCSSTQKINALKPEPDDASPLLYDNVPSFVDLPITIKLKDVENQINKSLNGLIYEDNNIEDDNLTIKVWKQAPIVLSNDEDGKIKTGLPLKVIINYRYGINQLGISLYDTREFNLNGKINLESKVTLANWKLNTETQFKSLDWNESPSVTIAGKSVAITYLINPAIRIFKSKIEKTIDDAIDKSLDFKPNVLDALEKICTPTLMNPEFNTWLRIVPIELYSTDAQIKKNAIAMQMGLKCNIETMVGQKPENKFERNKVILKPVAKMPDRISANIVAISTFKDASAIMNTNFQGKEFTSGSKKVTVQNVGIWHKDGKMVIALDMIGSLNGTVYLAGFPQYNPTTKEIYFDQLDYVLDTKSTLIRTANWLASGLILKKIQESCRYSIKANMEDGKQNMLKYMKNYSPTPGVFVNGSMGDIEFQKIQLTNKAIIAFLTINGNVNVTVDGLK